MAKYKDFILKEKLHKYTVDLHSENGETDGEILCTEDEYINKRVVRELSGGDSVERVVKIVMLAFKLRGAANV